MEGEQPAAVLPADAVALAELLGERMGVGKGNPAWLELQYDQAGRLKKWRRVEEFWTANARRPSSKEE